MAQPDSQHLASTVKSHRVKKKKTQHKASFSMKEFDEGFVSQHWRKKSNITN